MTKYSATNLMELVKDFHYLVAGPQCQSDTTLTVTIFTQILVQLHDQQIKETMQQNFLLQKAHENMMQKQKPIHNKQNKQTKPKSRTPTPPPPYPSYLPTPRFTI